MGGFYLGYSLGVHKTTNKALAGQNKANEQVFDKRNKQDAVSNSIDDVLNRLHNGTF